MPRIDDGVRIIYIEIKKKHVFKTINEPFNPVRRVTNLYFYFRLFFGYKNPLN
jgi:hypothetical protein